MIVVDTNIIAYLVLPSLRRADAVRLLRKDHLWRAPLLWRSEFRNVVAGLLRRGELSAPEALTAYDQAAALLRNGELPPDSRIVIDCIANSTLSAYDCEFVAVAQELSIPLVTADRGILRSFPGVATTLEAYLAA